MREYAMDDPQLDFGQDETGYYEENVAFREKPDGATDPAGEAGWFLQREREKRGETLEFAGDATGIHPYHIEAIEFGDMTRMPTRLEALEMISAYAQYLGFDPEPLIYHYVKFLPKPALAPRASHPASPAPLSSAKILAFGKMPKLSAMNFNFKNIPGGAGGLVASVAGAILLFAGASWMMMPPSDMTPKAEQTAMVADPMPTASTGPEAADVKVTEEKMPDDQVASAEPALANDPADQSGNTLEGLGAFIAEQVPDNTKAAAKIPPAQTASASAIDVKETANGRVFGAANEQARLVLKAKAPVWVRIEDAQGNVVMTQMLMKGDTYQVPNREGLVVIARDGGLLSYLIDGQEKGILGTPGEILVGRSLNLSTFNG
jgi:cytoskeleton protein RodZ